MKHILKGFLLSFLIPILPMSAQGVSSRNIEPVVILGGGVGSLTSAIYLGRAGLAPLVIEGAEPGGLLTQSHTVQNWPGELEIDGSQLTEKMRQQAEANGARFSKEEVTGVDFSKRPFTILARALDGSGKTHKIRAESCIIAMGTKPNFLKIPGEQAYWGKGVSNCAICDGSLYKGKAVGVVGGGDAAVLEALYLSNIAEEVYVFVRKGALKAVEEKRCEILRQKPNVRFFYNTTVQQVQGDGEKVTSVLLKTGSTQQDLPLNGLFLAIGSTPNSELFQNALKLDAKGYIILRKDQQTSVEGVYAIGDIADPVYKQAVSAAGDGAKAALQTQQFLSDKGLVVNKEKEKEQEKHLSDSAEVIEIVSAQQFQEELENSAIPLVVDFYATWCGPCKRISPLLESSASSLVGKVKFLKVNVDQCFDLSTSYNIRAMPTVLLLDPSGEELERKVGFDDIAILLKGLQNGFEKGS